MFSLDITVSVIIIVGCIVVWRLVRNKNEQLPHTPTQHKSAAIQRVRVGNDVIVFAPIQQNGVWIDELTGLQFDLSAFSGNCGTGPICGPWRANIFTSAFAPNFKVSNNYINAYHNAYEAHQAQQRNAVLAPISFNASAEQSSASESQKVPDYGVDADLRAYMAQLNDAHFNGSSDNNRNGVGFRTSNNDIQTYVNGELQSDYASSTDDRSGNNSSVLGEYIYGPSQQQAPRDNVTVLPPHQAGLESGDKNPALPAGEREPDIIVVSGTRARQHANKWH